MDKLFNEIPKELLVQYAKTREGEKFVIKVGGEIFKDKNKQEFSELLKAIQFLVKCKIKVVLVHGAGPQVTDILGQKKEDRSGDRITPPQKMEAVDKNAETFSKKIAENFEDVKIISPITIQSEKRGEENATADIIDLSPTISQIVESTALTIISHTGTDIESGIKTNINADEVATKLAKEFKSKLFFLIEPNGVIDANGNTIGEMHPDDIDPDDPMYKGGMKPKIKWAKDAAKNGCSVHMISWRNPGDIVQETFIPMGVPERATKIALEQTKEEWLEMQKITKKLLNQLVLLIKHNSNLLPRTIEEIKANLENWNLLVEDNVIKGAFEIKKQAEQWEMGGLIKPKFINGDHIGKKLFAQFEAQRIAAGITKAFALVKSENEKGKNFFERSDAQKKETPQVLIQSGRATNDRDYYEWS